MVKNFLVTFSRRRGRPKQVSTVPSVRKVSIASEYVDFLWQRKDISFEQHLAAVYYRTLYHQIHSSIGMPQLMSKDISSLSSRFGQQRSYFTPEERDDWYEEKYKTWQKLRQLLQKDSLICLGFVDDLIIHQSTHQGYFQHGLTKEQSQMLDYALTHMAQFYGLLKKTELKLSSLDKHNKI